MSERSVWRQGLAVAAGLALVAAVLAAVLAPVLPLVDPDTVDTPNRLRPPLSPGHALGTDEFGRDLLARLVWGARVSLLAGVATAAASMLVGVVLGVLGGFYTGWVEALVMRLTDVLMAFPYILLAIAIVGGLGPGLRNAMLAIAIVGFPIYTRLVRSIVLSLREREFVEAARALGATDPIILGRHILPHLLSPVIVAFSLDVGFKILATAGLSFLGLGTQPPTADWGSMLATGRQFVILSPHVALLPGLAIFVVVLALNLVGDALRDVLDPRAAVR
jgi:peptide/nickel transport system permease protein